MPGHWKLISLGDRKYRLETPSGRRVGWVRGHAVGLLGLRDKNEALAWAPRLRRALDNLLGREYPDRYRAVRGFHDLQLVHDGAYEWIAAGNVPIARLVRPSSNEFDGDLAIEFVLPSYVGERVTTAGAAVLANALRERIAAPTLAHIRGESTSRASTRFRPMNRTRGEPV
jgi:hypothetical protein